MIKYILICFSILSCLNCVGQHYHKLTWNPFLVKVYEKDSLLKYDNLLEGLKNPKTEWILVNEKIDISDTIIQLLTNHENLIQIDFSPLQNPALVPIISKIPNLKAYNSLVTGKGQSWAISNLESSVLKALLNYTPTVVKSWYDAYPNHDTLKSIFENIEYINISYEAWKLGAMHLDVELFPNLKYVDLWLVHPFKTTTFLNNIDYRPFISGIFPFYEGNSKLNLQGFRLINQYFSYNSAIKSTKSLKLCGAPNLKYLGFINCILPKNLYLCNLPLQTLIFKETNIPKIKDSDKMLTIRELKVYNSKKFSQNLIVHKRFPKLEKLKIGDYFFTSGYGFPSYLLKKTILKNNKTGINSRKLSKLNQLTHYELYGVKDRSLGFKLPKEKNNLTTLKIEKSGLWWPPKNLEEYKNLDTLILEVAFYRKNRLKKALLNLPNLKYVKISKSWIKGVAPNNKAMTIRHVEGDGVYTKLEWEIKENHPNDSLYLDIESKEYPLYYKNSPELEPK